MAIVPCKPFAEAKQRLAVVLDEQSRMRLARDLLMHTISILNRANGVARIAVISQDNEALRLARRSGAWAIWETHRGLNEALEQATRVAQANGINGVLVLPADLPELIVGDIDGMTGLAEPPPRVVIAPDRREEGTNALVINPAGLIQYAFGERSFYEHVKRAEQSGARVEVYRSPGLGFDLDLPEDWERMRLRQPRASS